MHSGETRTITIFYAVDTSDVMVGGGLEAVKEAIKIANKKFGKVSEYYRKGNFNINFTQVYLNFSRFGQVCKDLLRAVNSTEVSAILVLLASTPEDDYKLTIEQLRNNENFKQAFKSAIPIGHRADVGLLQQVVDDQCDICDLIFDFDILSKKIHIDFIKEMLLNIGIDVDNADLRRIIMEN